MSEIKNAPCDPNNPGLKKGDRLYGYEVKRVAELEEISAFIYELVHPPTGARHIHISNDDKENTFSAAFKTVPADSTGVAHILEHTALCGSRKFNVRDPFFSMLKRSLNTFMNAFTASDWTMYPFSTQNEKDFYNLLDVYVDAAFYPELGEMSFKQEGHRLEVDTDGNLAYKGVVYNEMKGAMSSPGQVMSRSLLAALYPTTTYGHNSGGEPSEIPTLTHEQLKAFHRRHYHPSNAFFYTYGNLPLAKHLKFIEERVLAEFTKIDPGTDVPPEPRWSKGKEVTARYPFSGSEDPESKHQVCVAWLTAGIEESFEILVLSLLGQVLLGNAAAPLRKALMDSGLGTALCDTTGFDADNRDSMFACGLKDVRADSAPAIEKIIMGVLSELAENGIDRELIDAAVHQMEFGRKEVTNTPYPYGIKLLLAISGSWFHGADPFRILQFDTDLERLSRKLEKGGFLEGRIRKYFFENPHRVLFTLSPDLAMEAGEQERVKGELAERKAALESSDLDRIRKESELLEQLQEAPEDISVLPTLGLSDIPPHVRSVAPSGDYGDMPATCYEQHTSGIFYLASAFGTAGVSEDLIPLVPFFSNAFTKMGTKKRDYAEMARLISATTGGIGMGAHARTRFDGSGEGLGFFSFNGKALARNRHRMFEIFTEMLHHYDFSDLTRLKSLLQEYRAALESSIVSNGHRLAMCLASRNFSTSCALGEAWHGVHQLKTLKAMTEDLSEERLGAVAGDLTRIAKQVLNRDNLAMAVVGGPGELAGVGALADSLTAGLPEGNGGGFGLPPLPPGEGTIAEGWSTNSAVSFVASVFKAVPLGHPDAPKLSVISKLLRSLYLHREIREKGGAYGGFANYNYEDGLFSFGSYRDPHIVNTLSVYKGAPGFLLGGDFSDEDIKEAILQVCSETDRPSAPGQAARKAFFRKLVSLSDEDRQHFKEQLLTVDRKGIREAAEAYFDFSRNIPSVAVISGAEKLASANEKLTDAPLKLFEI